MQRNPAADWNSRVGLAEAVGKLPEVWSRWCLIEKWG